MYLNVRGGGGGRELAADVEVGKQVVDGLCEDARPVDGVDRAEAVGRVELLVGKEGFDDILRNKDETKYVLV